MASGIRMRSGSPVSAAASRPVRALASQALYVTAPGPEIQSPLADQFQSSIVMAVAYGREKLGCGVRYA